MMDEKINTIVKHTNKQTILKTAHTNTLPRGTAQASCKVAAQGSHKSVHVYSGPTTKKKFSFDTRLHQALRGSPCCPLVTATLC